MPGILIISYYTGCICMLDLCSGILLSCYKIEKEWAEFGVGCWAFVGNLIVILGAVFVTFLCADIDH